jgi:hypothetical protein
MMTSIVGIRMSSFIITAGTAKIRAAINNGPAERKLNLLMLRYTRI